MKSFKIFVIIVIVLILGCIAISNVIYTVFPELAISAGFLLLPNPSKPVVKYGEFPFRLVYNLDGEQIVIEDAVICEYDGIGVDAGRGKFRKWKNRFLSSGDEVNRDGIVLLKDAEKTVFMDVGNAIYYMRDWENTIYDDSDVADLGIHIRVTPWNVFPDIIRDEEILERCNIKIIEWTHSPPIENSFK